MKILDYFLGIRELFIAVFLLAVTIAIVGGSRLIRLNDPQAIQSGEEAVNLYLDETIHLDQLARVLADSNLVESKEELLWAGRLLGWNTFASGHYKIDEGFTYDHFLSKLARGIQDPISLTIIPGTTKERVIEKITETFKFDSAALSQSYHDSTLLAEYGLEQKDVIGRMLPNTYLLYWTSSPESVLRRIFNEFERTALEPHRQRLQELDRSVDEIVTLASIIEWEAGEGDDKSIISGLYWNRLRKGMLLQADPTVNYAISERRRLLYRDYRIEHPYNTYVNRGLPPGPITNPSLSSIKAALYPEDHDYLYMVASPEGNHVYSETFEEHKRKSAKWREWIREQYRIKSQREREREGQNGTNS